MRILIGYDGSESSEAMLEELTRAGLPRVCDARVVTVADMLVSSPQVRAAAAVQEMASWRLGSSLEGAENHAEAVTRQAREHAERAADMVGLQFPEWYVTSEVMTGTPAWELIDAGDKWNADLIVVGSNSRSLFGRLLLGSVSKAVVTDSRRSVRVSRPRTRKNKDAPPRVIIGIDGSPASQAAVTAVGKRVWDEGTQVHLVAVHDGPSTARLAKRLPQAANMVDSALGSKADRQDQMLDWAAYELKMIGLSVTTSIQRGDPKRILLREAEKRAADSIFVGTREFRNAIERFRLGSVSSGVVLNAPCSVEVVRPQETEA